MSLEKKEQIMVIYIDFKKAFDKVSIPKLLHKLQHLGLSGLLLKCLESFLNDRFQAVRIQGAQSHFQKVKNGVPQGSVLGPFLFLLFINAQSRGHKDENMYTEVDDLQSSWLESRISFVA
jgi:hypothetical protein